MLQQIKILLPHLQVEASCLGFLAFASPVPNLTRIKQPQLLGQASQQLKNWYVGKIDSNLFLSKEIEFAAVDTGVTARLTCPVDVLQCRRFFFVVERVLNLIWFNSPCGRIYFSYIQTRIKRIVLPECGCLLVKSALNP